MFSQRIMQHLVELKVTGNALKGNSKHTAAAAVDFGHTNHFYSQRLFGGSPVATRSLSARFLLRVTASVTVREIREILASRHCFQCSGSALNKHTYQGNGPRICESSMQGQVYRSSARSRSIHFSFQYTNSRYVVHDDMLNGGYWGWPAADASSQAL